MKLVRDEWNGGLWVWKHYETRPGFVKGWFDYSPHFRSKIKAQQWIKERR